MATHIVAEYAYVRVRHLRDSPSGKTRVWAVENGSSGDELGLISWHGPWRQYVFHPNPQTLYSAGCLAGVAAFIQGGRK